MAAPVFNVTARKVGGIRFLKLGRINISLSVSKPAHAVKITARAMVERTGDGFRPVVFICRDGKPHSRHEAPMALATAGDAMFHARAAVASCGLALAR
jgi:uncharacterized protein YegL